MSSYNLFNGNFLQIPNPKNPDSFALKAWSFAPIGKILSMRFEIDGQSFVVNIDNFDYEPKEITYKKPQHLTGVNVLNVQLEFHKEVQEKQQEILKDISITEEDKEFTEKEIQEEEFEPEPELEKEFEPEPELEEVIKSDVVLDYEKATDKKAHLNSLHWKTLESLAHFYDLKYSTKSKTIKKLLKIKK